MKLLLSLLMLLIAVGDSWDVSWTPHESNVVLMIVTDCGKDFRAISRYTIGPEDSHALTYRTHGPTGSFCIVSAEIMRNATEDPSPDQETVGESTTLTVQE